MKHRTQSNADDTQVQRPLFVGLECVSVHTPSIDDDSIHCVAHLAETATDGDWREGAWLRYFLLQHPCAKAAYVLEGSSRPHQPPIQMFKTRRCRDDHFHAGHQCQFRFSNHLLGVDHHDFGIRILFHDVYPF